MNAAKKSTRQTVSRQGAGPSLGRQPADREGLWRRSGAGLHRGACRTGKARLDAALGAIIVRTVPDVRKAVKWNSPFYGVEDDVWFLSFHVFARYVK